MSDSLSANVRHAIAVGKRIQAAADAAAAADPLDTAIAYLKDLQALLDKARSVFPFSAADLPDIKEALGCAARFQDNAAECGVPGAAAKAARYRGLAHRIEEAA